MYPTRLIIAGVLSTLTLEFAEAQVTPGRINNTPHDLVISSTDDSKGEICVFCHTPHGARSDIAAPLWNKPATGATYTTYDSPTMDGDILTVGSVSVACLACHDGTQAMDAVINEPGTGAGDDGDMNALGIMPPFSLARIGPDMTNDHPIGVQYGGFNPGTGKVDEDFKGIGQGLGMDTSSLGLPRWWVDTEASPDGTRDKTDMILYTRNNGGNDQPFVECASCHDPHRGGGSPNFMRIANTNSNVCLACHVK